MPRGGEGGSCVVSFSVELGVIVEAIKRARLVTNDPAEANQEGRRVALNGELSRQNIFGAGGSRDRAENLIRAGQSFEADFQKELRIGHSSSGLGESLAGLFHASLGLLQLAEDGPRA